MKFSGSRGGSATKIRTVLVVCAAGLVATAGLRAQSQPAKVHVLIGRVLDDASDAPIAGAEVSIPDLNIRTSSDSMGAFRLPGVQAGRRVVWVRKIGFSGLSAVLDFSAGDTVDLDFALQVVAALPTVNVKTAPHLDPKMSQFEERRKSGFGGTFFTEQDLEKKLNRRMSEVVNEAANAKVVTGLTNAAWLIGRGQSRTRQQISAADRSRGAPTNVCYSAVVLDGTFVYQGLPGEQLWDLNSMQVSTIKGIEVYAGGATMPMEYNGTRNSCGLIVIWTK